MGYFSEAQKNSVWERGTIVEGYDKDLFRKDACGAWIQKDKYGVRDHSYGWDIDHIYPQSKLVSILELDNIQNLRPLHSKNNISKGDNYPDYKAVITSDGNKNIEKELYLTVNQEVQLVISKIFKI